MRHQLKYILTLVISLAILACACNKVKEFREDPDLTPLKQGFKTSAAISYCTSLAVMAFQGQPLPTNVRVSSGTDGEFSKSLILYIDTNTDKPIPFNSHIGEVIVAGIWDNDQESGVVSIIFGNLDLFGGDFQFYGMHTVPIKRKLNSERFISVFAEQDIVIGSGTDTLLHLGLSKIQFDTEIDRLDQKQPDDSFVAAQQNVWFIQFYQNEPGDIYDDSYELSGGGQIASASSGSGGITYHAFIEAKYDFGDCNLNPTRGTAFMQNIKAGDKLDLGHISLDFHSKCDGKAGVDFATGKYVGTNGRDVNLNFN